MTKDIKQIKTVSEALVIIKQLQTVCREQRIKIRELEEALAYYQDITRKMKVE